MDCDGQCLLHNLFIGPSVFHLFQQPPAERSASIRIGARSAYNVIATTRDMHTHGIGSKGQSTELNGHRPE